MLTFDQRRDYVTFGGGYCPYCAGEAVSIREYAAAEGPGEFSRTVACNDCNKTWLEVIRLVAIEETPTAEELAARAALPPGVEICRSFDAARGRDEPRRYAEVLRNATTSREEVLYTTIYYDTYDEAVPDARAWIAENLKTKEEAC